MICTNHCTVPHRGVLIPPPLGTVQQQYGVVPRGKSVQRRYSTASHLKEIMTNHANQENMLRRGSRRPNAGTKRAPGSSTLGRRSAGTCLSLDAAESDERHLGQADQTEAQAHVQQVNVKKLPRLGFMYLPCFVPSDYDWEPIESQSKN